MAVKEKVLGPDDVEVAITLRQLAVVHFVRKELDRAVTLLNRCADVLKKAEPTHRLLWNVNTFLITCYRKAGNTEAR